MFSDDAATTEVYALSLHDALPIFDPSERHAAQLGAADQRGQRQRGQRDQVGRIDDDPGVEARRRPELRDRKSTRLNSSHSQNSYAVFCLKKERNRTLDTTYGTERA